jgi:hypothetical protein
LKRLKDFPLNEWMEAADGCDFCKGKTMVRVTFVDESGDFGDVDVQRHHEIDCLDQEVFNGWGSDLAGWEYGKKVELFGKEFSSLKSRVNVALCLNCEKLVVGVPLILWLEEGTVELDFCFPCADEIGIMKRLMPR